MTIEDRHLLHLNLTHFRKAWREYIVLSLRQSQMTNDWPSVSRVWLGAELARPYRLRRATLTFKQDDSLFTVRVTNFDRFQFRRAFEIIYKVRRFEPARTRLHFYESVIDRHAGRSLNLDVEPAWRGQSAHTTFAQRLLLRCTKRLRTYASSRKSLDTLP